MDDFCVLYRSAPWAFLAPLADKAISADVEDHILALIGAVTLTNDSRSADPNQDGQICGLDLLYIESTYSILWYLFLFDKIIPMIILLVKSNYCLA